MPIVNGPLLRRTRKRRLESTAEVARDVGVAEGTLRNIESMRTVASDQLAYRLADRLGLDEGAVFSAPRSQPISRIAS